jgi:lysophospholipase L1-like esterase
VTKKHGIQRGITIGVAAVVLVGVITVFAAEAGAHGASRTATGNGPYYLSLGDSLSVGYQPSRRHPDGAETTKGYVDDLYKAYTSEIPGLQEEKLGCPGETSTSMATGTGSPCLAAYQAAGFSSQLAQAESFLETHDVAFVTIDIGANDVDGCVSDVGNQPAVDSCVEAGIDTINTNLPTILSGLESADTQGAAIYGMNYYDPFLALYLESAYTGPSGFAEQSVTLAQDLNSALASDYGGASTPVQVANVAQTFNTYATTVPSSYTPKAPANFGSTTDPLNVQAICTYTWECTTYENIHANKAGYKAIAASFEAAIGYLGG